MVDRDKFSDYSKRISFLDARMRVPAPSECNEPLPVDFEPGNWDVICQGGKESYDHIGNRRFRLCIENNLRRYNHATSKHERSLVVTTIVDAIRDSRTSEQGGFVRKDVDSGRWYEVGDKIAREKVGHALRDAIKFKTREQQCHSIGSHEKDKPKHQTKKRRRTMDTPVSQRDAATTRVPLVSPLLSKSESKIVSSEMLNKHRKESIHSTISASNAVREAEWEISLKQSTKQFQDSDDESDSVVEDNLHNGELNVKQVPDKNPSPIYSATKSLKPPRFLWEQDIGKSASIARTSDVNNSSTWTPPGFADLEDQFAQYTLSLGGLKDQPVGEKEEASMTTPFPKTVHHTVLAKGSKKLCMPKENHRVQSMSCSDTILICDSDDT